MVGFVRLPSGLQTVLTPALSFDFLNLLSETDACYENRTCRPHI